LARGNQAQIPHSANLPLDLLLWHVDVPEEYWRELAVDRLGLALDGCWECLFCVYAVL
jgi:hypothetical protein